VAGTKECTGCGSPNETILLNCAFCGTQLPKGDMDGESIPIEELLQNCSTWIGKYEAIASDLQILNTSKQKDQMAGQMLGKFFVKTMDADALSYSGTLSAINQYLDLLEVKTSESQTFRPKVDELKNRFENAKKNESRTKKGIYKLVVGIVLACVVFGIIISLGISGESQDKNDEIAKLDAIELKIETAILSDKFEYALILVDQLMYTNALNYPKNQKIAEQYSEKRKGYKASINKMIERTK
jgi:hypothetical protein